MQLTMQGSYSACQQMLTTMVTGKLWSMQSFSRRADDKYQLRRQRKICAELCPMMQQELEQAEAHQMYVNGLHEAR